MRRFPSPLVVPVVALSVSALVALGAACGEKPAPPAPGSTATTAAAASTGAASASSAASPSAMANATPPAPSASTSAGPATPPPSAAPDGMAAIPAGFYLMGGNGLDDKPEHEVAIAGFYVDKTEVTMAAYEKCVTAGKCDQLKDDNPFCNIKLKDRDKHPANCMTWAMADAYCAFAGSRLPTEREWEYLAKGGSEHRLYSWGDNDPTDKIACYMHVGGSCEVGSYPPGAFGLYDISGNVNEWTSSWYAPYPDEAKSGSRKVYRGGSWSRRFPKWLRAELRNHFKLDEEGAHLGVRCARSITPLQCPADASEKDGECVRTSGTPMDPQALLAARMARLEAGGGNGGPAPSGSNTSAAVDAPPSAWMNEKPVKIRSPEFDEDCKKHYQGRPNGYTYRGGSFAAREPVVASSGCVKRDIGSGWTSVCCPG